jgi:hypothetical protein
MPMSEAQKRYIKKWREANREKYNERQRQYANKYNAKHREERNQYSTDYYYRKINETHPAPQLELDEFLDQFNGEDFGDD